MERFLKENGFFRVRNNTDNTVESIYYHPDSNVLVTIFRNGKWNAGKAGSEGLEHIEYWRGKISKFLASKGK